MGQSHHDFTTHGEVRYVAVDEIFVNRKKRRKLSEAKIAQYAKAYDNGDTFPPISVDDNGDFYTIADGRHRFQAQLLAGHRVVEVSVR